MTDRPIIFSAPMVRALLSGSKTQTRRLATSPLRRVEAGDRLYVREQWRTDVSADRVKPRDLPAPSAYWTDADGCWQTPIVPPIPADPGRRRPGMHMPRWASRLTLIVEAVKVERLQAISDYDAACEGLTRTPTHWQYAEGGFDPADPTPVGAYRHLWNSLHGAEAWDANPFVVALAFRVERTNIDRIAA